MKYPRSRALALFCLAFMLFVSVVGFGQALGKVLVHSKFGGQIFGFDIDQNGTEGVLSESQTLSNGLVLAAVETFDQRTGQILSVVTKTQTSDDFVTLGVVGNGVGLIDHEVEMSLFHVTRFFQVINPLSANRFTGVWTPPLAKQDIIMPNGVSRSQGGPNVAVFVYDNSGQFKPKVFSSNVAANTFSPFVTVTDGFNFGSVPPPIAYDTVTNQAILGGGPGCFFCRPVIGLVDLTKATFSEFQGIGFGGFINGIAVDSADGIFVTTSEDDAGVEFYSISSHTGFSVQLPNSGGQQFYSGADVEYDPIHKFFFVAQPNSSVSSGSTIYVYDIQGNLLKTLNGFKFSNTGNVIPMHIALNPTRRTAFVDGPDPGVTEIQGFIY